MELTADKVAKLLKGHHKFSNLGFALLVTSLRGKYMRDGSAAALAGYTKDINAFIAKNKTNIANDISILSSI